MGEWGGGGRKYSQKRGMAEVRVGGSKGECKNNLKKEGGPEHREKGKKKVIVMVGWGSQKVRTKKKKISQFVNV